jgi:hypothetical protein
MGENFSPIFKPTLDKPEIIMNVIKTQADAIKYLQSATTGDEILENLNQLPSLIITDTYNAVSSTMNDDDEDKSMDKDNWAELPVDLFQDEIDEDDDDISVYTNPYEEVIN